MPKCGLVHKHASLQGLTKDIASAERIVSATNNIHICYAFRYATRYLALNWNSVYLLGPICFGRPDGF